MSESMIMSEPRCLDRRLALCVERKEPFRAGLGWAEREREDGKRRGVIERLHRGARNGAADASVGAISVHRALHIVVAVHRHIYVLRSSAIVASPPYVAATARVCSIDFSSEHPRHNQCRTHFRNHSRRNRFDLPPPKDGFVAAFNPYDLKALEDPEVRRTYAAKPNPDVPMQQSSAYYAVSNGDIESLQAMADGGWEAR